jgi:hypothetical protein
MKNHNGIHGPVPTWVARTGGGGWHYYFSLPAWLDECPSRRLWGVWDTWGGPKHCRRLDEAQGSPPAGRPALAIAPPSSTSRPASATSSCRPLAQGVPPADPAWPWLLNMPAIVNPQTVIETPMLKLARDPAKTPTRPAGEFFDRDEVLAAIATRSPWLDPGASAWPPEGPNPKGWWSCHAIDREDATPSASIHEESGVYAELRDGRKLPFFDLAVALGVPGLGDGQERPGRPLRPRACPRGENPSLVWNIGC